MRGTGVEYSHKMRMTNDEVSATWHCACHLAGAPLPAERGDVALLHRSCCVGACCARRMRCLGVLGRGWWWPLMTVVGEVGRRCARWWWLRVSGVVCR